MEKEIWAWTPQLLQKRLDHLNSMTLEERIPWLAVQRTKLSKFCIVASMSRWGWGIYGLGAGPQISWDDLNQGWAICGHPDVVIFYFQAFLTVAMLACTDGNNRPQKCRGAHIGHPWLNSKESKVFVITSRAFRIGEGLHYTTDANYVNVRELGKQLMRKRT